MSKVLVPIGSVFVVFGVMFFAVAIPAGVIANQMTGSTSGVSLGLVFVVLGVIFALIGAGFLLVSRQRSQRLSWLRQHGQEVWTTVADVRRTRNVRPPGYVVHAAWQDPATGQTHTATSDAMWTDPRPRLAAQPWVRVLFDPEDPRRNLVDIEARPSW